jgi:hypothetical protein
MNNKPSLQPAQKIKTRNGSMKDVQIGQAGRDNVQVQANTINIVVKRFFNLLSQQALKGSLVGIAIGLALMTISHRLYEFFQDYTTSAEYAELICAILVGVYCNLFCGNLIKNKSKKVFLAVFAFLITLWSLPLIRSIFLSIFENFFDRNASDTISYSISYAIICILAGGVIETIANMINKK